MKCVKSILCFLVVSVLVSCTGNKGIIFSDDIWTLSRASGNMINSDSTLQFTFGDHPINFDMTVISNHDSVRAYPGSEKYIRHLLEICGLQDSKVCFYVPSEFTMWVELPQGFIDEKPRSVCSFSDSSSYTSWVWDDDVYEGNRTSEQIYSNSFADRRSKVLIMVDKMTYGNRPMACLSIYQSATKAASKLGFKPWYWTSRGNLLDYSYIDILANWVDSRRAVIEKNYRLGQTVEYRKNLNEIKAELKDILLTDQEPRNRIVTAWQQHPQDTLLHRKIAAEILHNDSVNQVRVCEILDSYPLDFGEENEVIWAVIQHSDIDTQKKYLHRFVDAVKTGRMRGEFVAVMQDRIACREGKPQKYGSQGNYNEDGIFVPAEIEDRQNVDVRRAQMGMCPISEYIEKMSRH